jgi:hypothetical protein
MEKEVHTLMPMTYKSTEKVNWDAARTNADVNYEAREAGMRAARNERGVRASHWKVGQEAHVRVLKMLASARLIGGGPGV